MALYASAASAGSTRGLPAVAVADLSIRSRRASTTRASAAAMALVEASTGSFQRLVDGGA